MTSATQASGLRRRPNSGFLRRLGSRLPSYGQNTSTALCLRMPPGVDVVPTPKAPRPAAVAPTVARGDGWSELTLGFVVRAQLVRLASEVQRKEDILARFGGYGAAEAYLTDVRHAVTALIQLVDEHGWPGLDTAGRDGCDAALVIAQAAGLDEQRRLRAALAAAVAAGRLPESHLLHLSTLIARATGTRLDDVAAVAGSR